MRRLVILNPVSRGGRARELFRKLEPELKTTLGSFEVFETRDRLDATTTVRKVLSEKRFDQLLVAGGDGTVNEVVNGYFDGDRLLSNSTGLGIVNLGSGGDFFRGLLQVSPDYQTALRENRIKHVDCGKLTIGGDSKYFINIASVGVAGNIMYSRENSSFRAGTVAYFYHTLKCLVAFEPLDMKISWVDEKNQQQESIVKPLNVFVCNGRFNGAGMNWAPQASISDGLFDVVFIAGVSKLKLVSNSRLVYAGQVSKFPGIKQFHAREVTISPGSMVRGEADGEIYESRGFPLHYKMIPATLPLVM